MSHDDRPLHDAAGDSSLLATGESVMKTVINSLYFTWGVLALPSIPMLVGLINGASPGQLLHPTGEFAARFMIIAMMITPLSMLFSGSRVLKGLLRRRRALGVAAFMYAAAHTLFYVIDLGGLQPILAEFWTLGIWTGWFAMAIMVPLAVTSNNRMVKALKSSWKPLQRWVYPAAVLTLVHWIFVHNNVGPALVHFIPLAALEAYRVYKNTARSRV